MRKNTLPIALAAIALLVLLPSISSADEKNVTFTLKIYMPDSVVVSIQPSLRTTTAGSQVSYAASIENPNPVRLSLNLALDLPSGFTGEAADSATVSAEGSKTVTFTVKSANETPVGSYKIGIIASTEDSSFTGKAYASYNIDVRADADVRIYPQALTGLPGETLRYTASVFNKDPAGFEARTFSVYPIIPKNWKGKLTYGGRTDSTASVRINASSGVDIEYEVTSPADAKSSAQIGVNVTSSKMSTDAYAGYDITLCGDGICGPDEPACAADCGPEPRFSCSGRCEETVDDGVRFSASADFGMTKFAVCKRTSTVQQCKTALQGGCGAGKNCICGSEGGVITSSAECGVACVDSDGAYYIYGESLSEAARSAYNYSFECPFVNLTEIKALKADYSSALTSFRKAKSTLAESIELSPLEKIRMQPCLDAHTVVIEEVDRYVKFLANVIERPAISNTTKARELAETVSRYAENKLAEFCSAGTSGLLAIKSISQPGDTEVRKAAQSTVVVENPGSVAYYGYLQCEFSSGSRKAVYNTSCSRFNAGASRSFTPSANVTLVGDWKLQCRTYGSVSENCTGAALHDSSSDIGFGVVSRDIFVKDVAGACSSGVECVVRTSRSDSCVECYINGEKCAFRNQTSDRTTFRCPYVPGNFTLTGKVAQSDSCTAVEPSSKTITTRCQICGDGVVDKSLGEQCEMPDTYDNQYVAQQSGLLCDGARSTVKDAFGYCSANCKAIPDASVFECKEGVCGAQCSDGAYRSVVLEKAGGSCQCIQNCSPTTCAYDACDCTP